MLVIDDDPTQRDLIQRFLSKEGFCVRTAAAARRAAPGASTAAGRDHPRRDDARHGRLERARQLKADADLRDIPVDHADDGGRSSGASRWAPPDYATKPVDRARLSRLLKKYTCPHPPCPVLLVDDDPAARELTRAILEKEGWKVSRGRNGRVGSAVHGAERPA